jgi:hypothetical protein
MTILRFDREAEEQFLNKAAIVEVARVITEAAKKTHSTRHYKKLSNGLGISWTMTEDFRAGAYIASNGDHEIRLSYGSAIEIYRDAFVLPHVCQRTLTNSAFDPIFNLLCYGNERQDVLPVGLNPANAKIVIIQLMTTWLYLHEQAHLLQRHGDIAMAQGAADLLSHDGGLDDSKDSVQTLRGPEAALRHAFELAADYEAITSLMFAESKDMDDSKLWCLTAGLMCMFHRFYRTSAAAVDREPQGTHPHPGLRMRVVMNRIEQMFAIPEFAAGAQWQGGAERARAVMDHAIYAADAYWHLRYLGLDARSPFLDLVVSTIKVPESYQHSIYNAWSAVQVEIIDGHLGFGDAVVLFLRSAASVGERVEPFVLQARP